MHINQRNKVLLAIVGSLGLHACLLLLWALTLPWFSHGANTSSQPTPSPLKLTIEQAMPEPAVVPAPIPPPPPKFRDATDMAEAATPPPDAKFESMKNTAAASELPTTGDRDAATQQGRAAPMFVLDSAAYLAGDPAGKTGAANTPPPETAPPRPQAAARSPQAAPAAVAAPVPTPAPRPGDFALATPASLPVEPKVEEPNPFDPSFRPPSSLTEPPLPTPVRYGNRKSYQSQRSKTAVNGNINNRGAASLASVASPLGRYQGAVIEAIRRRWNGYIESRSDIASLGSVKIHFLVGMDGKARAVQIVTNSANEALASISIMAIADAKIPPMPSEAVPDTGGGQLPMDITFEFIAN